MPTVSVQSHCLDQVEPPRMCENPVGRFVKERTGFRLLLVSCARVSTPEEDPSEESRIVYFAASVFPRD